MELLTVVIVLGVLTAIAVPIFSAVLTNVKKNDCSSQRQVIQADVRLIMSGMEDNGIILSSMSMQDNDGTDSHGAYWILATDKPTMAQLRHGKMDPDVYADLEDYSDANKNYLKKPSMETKTLSQLFTYSEIPVCPFTKGNLPYEYRIYADGTVRCTCPECAE